MLPLRDHHPTQRRAVVTFLLLVANVGVYFVLQPQADSPAGMQEQLRFTFRYAAIPCELVEGRPLNVGEVESTLRGDETACGIADRLGPGARQPVFPAKSVVLAVVSSMFLHAGLLHLGGNALFLWIFGNNIEDRLGALPYLIFYAASGLVATAAHVLVQPTSTVPVVGASGAIAGVMGAYFVWYPRTPIRTLFFFTLADLPARVVLGFWFVSQFFVGSGSGVAWVAHVGGFLFGAAVAMVAGGRGRPSATKW